MSKINKGYYSAKYFLKTEEIIKTFRPDSIVTLQFFQRKNNAILGGIDEVIRILKSETRYRKYTIKSLQEGSLINKNQVVLELEGKYAYFGKLEGIIDGILSRLTSMATNARNVVNVANGKDVIFMGDRSDLYINQKWDGYAISLGGIKKQVTQAHKEKKAAIIVGTIPHVLIQMFEGDLVVAMHAYHSKFPEEKLVGLVDFNNDVIMDSLKILKEFGNDLYAVRVDTSIALYDKYFEDKKIREYGVNPTLIKALRSKMDEHNGEHVKIIVSSGFDVEKIKLFEKLHTPVDVYGVGQSLLKIDNTFTADATKINGKKIAKKGRYYKKI